MRHVKVVPPHSPIAVYCWPGLWLASKQSVAFALRRTRQSCLFAGLLLLASTLCASLTLAQNPEGPAAGAPNPNCPAATITSTRAAAGSNWNLSAVVNQLKQPAKDLVMVAAHRGLWQYCPENTIESMLSSFDNKVVAVEMDVRLSKPNTSYPKGEAYLTHDYDLRGEVPDGSTGPANNYIYTRTPDQLLGYGMHDRFGMDAFDSQGTRITFHSLTDLLTAYYSWASQLPNGVVNGQVQRGAELVIDIKGGDTSQTVGGSNDPNDPGQLATLIEVCNEVTAYETANTVDLTGAILFKINYNQMVDSNGPITPQLFASNYLGSKIQLYKKENPNLAFIVYPADVLTTANPPQVIPPTDTSLSLNQWRSGTYAQYLISDYQVRYPGISLDSYVSAEIAKGKGVAAFQSTNSYPEGYRQSGGTCLAAEPKPGVTKLSCNSQPLISTASATLGFLVPNPAVSSLPRRATFVTTDWFLNAMLAYLPLAGLENTTYIK
jgi:glycerophosphoryl diester phosphodiesterase